MNRTRALAEDDSKCMEHKQRRQTYQMTGLPNAYNSSTNLYKYTLYRKAIIIYGWIHFFFKRIVVQQLLVSAGGVTKANR